MADNTKIEWTDATWNPVTGCSVVSPGCAHCYAMKLAGTRLQHHASRAGLTTDSKSGPVWSGKVRFNEEWLMQPLKWKRRRMIFVCAHGDLFHESVPDEWIDRVFAVMALAPQHTFQVLTKRAERMRDYVTDQATVRRVWQKMLAINPDINDVRKPEPTVPTWPLPNIWLGVSAEDQKRADERLPHLASTPAAVRFVSIEPLLGEVSLAPWLAVEQVKLNTGLHWTERNYEVQKIDWVIAGGESGPGARPMHPDWARSLRDQCAATGVPFFFKQHGEWIGVPDLRGLLGGTGPGFGAFDHCKHDMEREAVRVGKKAAGRLLDGIEHNGMPEVRQ